MQHFLIISIGPVQEFIASARRSRDLWFGSWLLSELSKAAAKEIVNQHTNNLASLIFPTPETITDLQAGGSFNVPNKIVALVEQHPSQIWEKVWQAIDRRLCEIRNNAYSQIRENFDRATAIAQVEDMIESFWAALPLESLTDYHKVRERVEALMAARKVTRNFKPVTWGCTMPKSSLDGQRESVIPEAVYDQYRNKPQALRRAYGVRKGERLCGVGLLKRHGQYGEGDRFMSTSHVAALPLLHRLTAKDKPAVDEYIKNLKNLGLQNELGNVPGKGHPVFSRYDGHLLFEERLGEFFEDDNALIQAKQALDTFLKKTLDGKRPLSYYALLHADGDRMGKAIDEQKTIEQHRTLSRKLTEFAAQIRAIVEAHEGSLVYSGGDDVLAFLPLHTVLNCARQLADKFKENLKAFEVQEGSEHISPTLSVGVAVVHHLEPLSDALELARAAEKTAKSVSGKNALAVTVSKRSGVDRTVKGTWGTLDQRLKTFTAFHCMDAIPDSAAYELHDLALRLSVPDNDPDYKTLQQAMRYEAVRILQRKRAAHGGKALDESVLKKLEEIINVQNIPIEQLANELIVARLFADAERMAGVHEDTEEKSV